MHDLLSYPLFFRLSPYVREEAPLPVPVRVKIGGRSAGWFEVSEVQYGAPGLNGPFGRVIFMLSRVSRAGERTGTDETSDSESPPEGNGTFVMDITHFLDEHGELASMPAPARKLASFLVLLIEAATQAFPQRDHDTGIRCRIRGCEGSMRTSLSSPEEEITWHCPACGHHGIIRNWDNTRWNQWKRKERSE